MLENLLSSNVLELLFNLVASYIYIGESNVMKVRKYLISWWMDIMI